MTAPTPDPLGGSTGRIRIKSGRASLVGGLAVGLAVLLIWILLARDLGAGTLTAILPGALIAALIAVWIRIADL